MFAIVRSALTVEPLLPLAIVSLPRTRNLWPAVVHSAAHSPSDCMKDVLSLDSDARRAANMSGSIVLNDRGAKDGFA